MDAILAEFAKKSDYHMEFSLPKPKDKFYRASFSFEDSILCCKLIRRLCEDPHSDNDGVDSKAHSDSDGCHGAKLVLNDHELSIYQVQVSLSSSTRYTPEVFSVIKPSIQHVCDRYSRSLKSVAVKSDKVDRWGNGFVDITATNLKAFTEAKEMLAKAVAPEMLVFSGFSTCQYMCTVNFQKTLEQVQMQTSAHIKFSACSSSTSSVAIYGTKNQQERVKEEVERHLRNMLRKEVRCFEVNLKEYAPGLMKHLIGQYGSNLASLPQGMEGITTTRLNPRRQILTLFATEAGYNMF